MSTTSTPGTGTKLGERRSSARAEAAPAYRARREEIIAAAGKAFLAKGYRATSFRDIADAVGVDRASLYYYFESKHELFRAATSVAVQRNVADAESIAASDQPPAAKVAEIVQRLLASYTDRDYPYMFIFLQEDVNGISDDSDDEWAREMNDYNRRYERAVTAAIAEGSERGDFVLPGTPHVLTKTVVGMANWLQHWYRADGPMSAADIAEVFASTFLYGVMRREEAGTVTTTEAIGTEAPYVNVLDPDFYTDPWDAYRWLRDEAPCFWDPVQELWVVSRYDDVMATEKDGGRYSSFVGSRPQIDQSADRSMINMDDPTHQEQRKLVARRFNPGGVRGQEDHVRALVTEILDPVVPLRECEVIEAIASRLPAMMIGDLLGYPRDMWELLRHWSERTMTLGGLNMTSGPPYVSHPDVVPVMLDFFQQTAGLVETRRAEPRDDLISIWAAQGWETGHVLEETLLLLDGGAETTRTVIGSMIRELALQPDQRRLLVEHPDLLGTTAIEEFIRWVTPILNMRRTVTEEHELHGQTLREGDQVVLMYAAANRDPRAFSDPDRLDVTRPDNRHVSFGFGTHFCLGAWLARLELRVMFEELLRRIPEWELVDPDEPQIVPGTFARAYDQIRIRY